MKKAKAIIILPIVAATALLGTGFGAWVFASNNTTYHTGANIEVADAYGYDDLKVEWIDHDLVLEQDKEDHTQGAPIDPISFSVTYTAQVGIGGTNTYVPGADGAEGNYEYSSHTISGEKTIDFGYSVQIKTDTINDYVTPKVTIAKSTSNKDASKYKSTTDLAYISNQGDTISVKDRITAASSEDVTVVDIVTVSFVWKEVPKGIDFATGGYYNYASLKKLLSDSAPLVFNINMASPKEAELNNINLDSSFTGGMTLRQTAASSNTVIFGKTSEYKDAIKGLTAVQVGSTSDDKVFAYYDSNSSSLYILSDGTIALSDGIYTNSISDYSELTGKTMAELMTVKLGLFESIFCTTTSLTLTNIDTFDLTNANLMFAGMTQLKTLDLSGMNTSQITSFRSMFVEDASLETLNLTSFNTMNATDMTAMFDSCIALKTITVTSGSFVTDQVTESDYMFEYCYELTGPSGTKYKDTTLYYATPEDTEARKDVKDANKDWADDFLTYVTE